MIGSPRLPRSSLAALTLLAPLALLFHASASPADAKQVLALSGDVAPVHDPTAIAAGRVLYVFSNGGRPGQGVIPMRTSTDLRAWKPTGFVIVNLPDWATREIPRARVGAQDYLVFNAYYGVGRGRGSALQISTMTWEDGWPKVGSLP